MRDENAIVIEAWNTVLFEKFTRFRRLVTAGLSGHSDALWARHPVSAGQRVLDVGCGFGDTTQQIAIAVGPSGKAVGVDCAANFIDIATREARAAGLEQASFLVGDVQFAPLGGPYDRVFSRFGTMFFNLPGAALRNIRRSLAPGAQATFIVWRRREDNPWLFAAEQTVREIVPVVSHEQTNQVHCGPGPFAWAGADTVSDLLQGAGYDRVSLERVDLDICIGHNLDQAVEFATALGPAGEILRLAGTDGERLRGAVLEALQKTLQQFQRDDGKLWAPSSTWFVSARNP
ncbi:MAG TPA: class I SAM-dependent methyltransferase [Polyangiaceae bacterium]|jgi:ubiquinone/menaquinone biosynthesis C-methylase UbiE|nr:class I SAM-dependent methyltransferase [Polyangiaceae bacterium]